MRSQLYFIGFIATILFSSRTVVQWFQSERSQRSIASSFFWKLSIAGNFVLSLHAFIQVQFVLCIVQALLGTLGLRSMNLKKEIEAQWKFKNFIIALILTIFLVTCAFLLQSYLCFGEVDWVRTPTLPWKKMSGEELSLGWHLFGAVGIITFSLRYWIHWWQAESHGQEDLSPLFWLASMVGAAFSLIYFIKLHDVVNILGYGFSFLPVLRNLMIIKKSRVLHGT